MERESLLTLLIVLLGGVALQVFASWPRAGTGAASAAQLERTSWARLWWPLFPALTVSAWLCGWALSEPDPVPNKVGALLFVVCAPFGLLFARAVVRAVWSLLRRPDHYGIATVGIIRPQIILSPDLARLLNDRTTRAALEHERAHARHRDPLRIWAGQFATDLQWPWRSAHRRFEGWLAALECARDDEARAAGIDGQDLAAAVVASLRFHRNRAAPSVALLTGNASALKARVARLLQPLAQPRPEQTASIQTVLLLLASMLLFATGLGVAYGERVIGPLLAVAS